MVPLDEISPADPQALPEEALQHQLHLYQVAARAQRALIEGVDPRHLLSDLLDSVQELTDADTGYVAAMTKDPSG